MTLASALPRIPQQQAQHPCKTQYGRFSISRLLGESGERRAGDAWSREGLELPTANVACAPCMVHATAPLVQRGPPNASTQGNGGGAGCAGVKSRWPMTTKSTSSTSLTWRSGASSCNPRREANIGRGKSSIPRIFSAHSAESAGDGDNEERLDLGLLVAEPCADSGSATKSTANAEPNGRRPDIGATPLAAAFSAAAASACCRRLILRSIAPMSFAPRCAAPCTPGMNRGLIGEASAAGDSGERSSCKRQTRVGPAMTELRGVGGRVAGKSAGGCMAPSKPSLFGAEAGERTCVLAVA
mmetsp:Transcript_53584/g.105674  ORF Transcript_53584/g.105674 Transcript_53584/m.105674 type:complete len:299 (-) Transcript_53584:170-1066(-)